MNSPKRYTWPWALVFAAIFWAMFAPEFGASPAWALAFMIAGTGLGLRIDGTRLSAAILFCCSSLGYLVVLDLLVYDELRWSDILAFHLHGTGLDEFEVEMDAWLVAAAGATVSGALFWPVYAWRDRAQRRRRAGLGYGADDPREDQAAPVNLFYWIWLGLLALLLAVLGLQLWRQSQVPPASQPVTVGPWLLAAESPPGRFYYDPATIARAGATGQASALLDFSQSTSSVVLVGGDEMLKTYHYLSKKLRIEINCGKDQARTLSYSVYAGTMARGEAIYESAAASPWASIAPHSIQASLRRPLCH